MSTRQMVAMISILFIILVSFSKAAFPEIKEEGRPVFIADEYWIFKNNEGKETKTVFLKEEGNHFVFEYNGDQIIYLTYDLTPIKRIKKETGEVVWEKSLSYPGPVIQFPLKIGQWWTRDYKAKSEKYKGNITSMIAQYEVKAYEQITVPAGTFWAFRIEATRYATTKGGMRGNYYGDTYTYWYAPSVKRVIKHNEGKGTELIKYGVQIQQADK